MFVSDYSCAIALVVLRLSSAHPTRRRLVFLSLSFCPQKPNPSPYYRLSMNIADLSSPLLSFLLCLSWTDAELRWPSDFVPRLSRVIDQEDGWRAENRGMMAILLAPASFLSPVLCRERVYDDLT